MPDSKGKGLQPWHLLYVAAAGDAVIAIALLPFLPILAYAFVKAGWVLLIPFGLFTWSFLKPESWFPAVLFFVLSVGTWLWLLSVVQSAIHSAALSSSAPG